MINREKKPVVGITMDIETTPGYTREPWYALRTNYVSAVAQAGGVPLCLPHEIELVSDYLSQIDALVVTGGLFDIPPRYYNESPLTNETHFKIERTAFEYSLLQAALEKDIPIVGICGGMQLLAVLLGAKLIQDIGSIVDNAQVHMQETSHNNPHHEIHLLPDRRLSKIMQTSQLRVNSVHHQAVCELPDRIKVSAHTIDGVIEAIEVPDRRFTYGFQWHPEFNINIEEALFFEAFIQSAQRD